MLSDATSIRRHWPRWTIARRLCAAAFVGLLVLGRFDWFPYFAGSTTATRLFQIVPLADPLAALEVTLATRDAAWDILVGAGLLVLVSVIFGPVFCGWACPLGLLLDLNDWLRRQTIGRFFRRPRRAPDVERTRAVRFAILGGTAAFSLFGAIPLFQVLSPINVIGHLAAIARTVGPGLLLLAAILLVEYFRPRLWCRVLCPLGALYSLLGSFAVWRVRIRPEEEPRQRCRECTLNCPMGIRVMEDYVLTQQRSVDHWACTRCGACIDACPGGVLSLGFSTKTAADSTRA